MEFLSESARRNDGRKQGGNGERMSQACEAVRARPLHKPSHKKNKSMGHRIERLLPCELTDDQVNEVAKELAKNVAEYNALEEEKKQVTKDYAERLQLIDTLQRQLAKVVETGKEERPVMCEWDYHSPRNMKRLIRQDTFEVVEVLEMNDRDHEAYAAEMQTQLPL